ncbi:GTP-binding protein [Veillonella rodentium]|uniref:Uncharacterized GTP-binding protein YjiA n=1 Tax=Veillonella rodentium TaxID=248315 RepID=A0A239YFB6_9FIRM|nr:GTP-binding protein [Veillonella rodentium]SNV57537.1 Uncharacterized GTP-binding protein YjiA [Veillonella rodentium]
MIPIVIISGFLGSGKTTFLQHILKEHKTTDKVLIIENDFGETSLDAVHLAQTGATVQEVTSGCICCSLQGNFREALLNILKDDSIDVIYIEPSGVSKLSEILQTCEDEDIAEKAYVYAAITTVDAMQAPMFIKNFGLFFKDQITHSDAIFLSHTTDSRQTDVTKHMIDELAPHTPIHEEPWDTLTLRDYINQLHHDHHVETLHDHHHFMSHTYKNLRSLTTLQWKTVMEGMPDTVLRAKGIVPTAEGPHEIQYGTHYCTLSPTESTDYSLVVIGTDFNVPMVHNEVCES